MLMKLNQQECQHIIKPVSEYMGERAILGAWDEFVPGVLQENGENL